MRYSILSIFALAAASFTAASPSFKRGSDDYFVEVFDNKTAATQSQSYMTFTLVEPSNAELACKEFCLKICDCKAVNLYLDNYGKGITLPDGTAELYTCSAFNQPIDDTMNTNMGGQDQHGDGHLNSISKSQGWVVGF